MTVVEATNDDVGQRFDRVVTTHILVVEDDLVIQSLVAMVLQYGGYDVTCAGDGQQGVALARSELPDMIFMDLMLPVLDGQSAINMLKRDPTTQHIPIVAMSASDQLRELAARSEIDGMLAKPFDIDVLLAQVAVLARPPA